MFERKWGIALCALAFTQVALAQLAGDDLDWKEAEVPTPPAFEIARLIPFEVTADSAIRFGLDPASISIGKDGVVRYVVVARSTSGVVTGLYEGIRCARGEFRTYARHNAPISASAPGCRGAPSPARRCSRAAFDSEDGLRHSRRASALA
jgi:hypothetical protein